MKKTIFLSDVLKNMKSGSFDITVREWNRQNKTGGKLKKYKNVRILKSKSHAKNKLGDSLFFKDNAIKRNPRHWENRTRNLELPNGEIKKINILLIIEFNGQKVVY